MRALCLAVVTVLSLSTSAAAQLPDSPRGRAGNAFINAFNSGERWMLEAFVQDFLILGDRKAADVVDTLMADFEATGGLQLRGAEAQPNGVTMMGRAKNGGEPWTVKIRIQEDPPHKIEQLDMNAGEGPPPGGIGVPELPDGAGNEAIAAAIDAFLESLTKADKFAGVALVERQGEVIFEGAYGQSSKRFGVDNRIDTRFNLGSINKMFTLLCAAKLVSEDRLAWSDSISKWLPDYSGAGAETITVEHLASMRSGLGDIFVAEFSKTSKDVFREPSDFFPLFMGEALQFEPGTSRAYSNAGYMVLGEIVARAAGESYFDYVRRTVYEPAGMASTDAFEADDPVENLAEGYTKQLGADGEVDHGPGPGAAWRSNVFHNLYKGSPAGGGYSTAHDLLRFVRAMREGRLMDLAVVRDAFAIGFGQRDDAGGMPALGVAGGGPGVNANLDFGPDSAIIVLSNYDPPAARDAAGGVRSLVAN